MSDASLLEPCSLASKLRLRCNGRGTCQKHSANGIALTFIQVGHHSTSPAHRNKGHPGARRLRRIYRGMRPSPVARARPTTHARLHPAAAQRSAVRRKPKRRSLQGTRVCIRHRSNWTTSSKQQMQNQTLCYPGKSDIPTKNPYSSRYRSCNVRMQPRLGDAYPSIFPDWIRRRETTTHFALEHPQPTPASFVLCPSAPPHMQALTLHVASRMCGRRRLLAHKASPSSASNPFR
jgi:hypothetical protein